tara:strand:- start:75181 stop:75285 length:105 start_codon:yes stop_codon:yes gene_type:complete
MTVSLETALLGALILVALWFWRKAKRHIDDGGCL